MKIRGMGAPKLLMPEEQNNSYKVDDDGSFIRGEMVIKDSGMKWDNDDDFPKTGIKLEDLEVLEVLGEGASSIVHRVCHVPTQRSMALKKINVFERSNRRQLVKELHTLHNADCPYLISFYGAFYKDGAISIALELMDLGSLQDVLLVVKKVPEIYLAAITKQMLRGLAYLRKKHQIHRDIKPANSCINSRGEVKLSDFGITSQLDSTLGACDSFVGTSSYMSPERILGDKYSYPSDIWSLGLCILECALGRFPYPKTSIYLELLDSIVKGNTPAISEEDFSKDFCSFIECCLKKDPEKRSTAIELLTHPYITSCKVSRKELSKWLAQNLKLKVKEATGEDADLKKEPHNSSRPVSAGFSDGENDAAQELSQLERHLEQNEHKS